MASIKYAITYEFDIKAPLTVRGAYAGNDEDLAVRRAMTSIRKAYPRAKWDSLCLTLEKPRQIDVILPKSTRKGQVTSCA